jgi:hypothetical protein
MGGIVGAVVSGVESLVGGSSAQDQAVRKGIEQMGLLLMQNTFQQFQQQLQQAQKDSQSQ